MARGPNQLTSNQVRNAKPGPDGKAVLLCDGATLWLHIGRAKHGRITKSRPVIFYSVEEKLSEFHRGVSKAAKRRSPSFVGSMGNWHHSTPSHARIVKHYHAS